MPAQEREGYDIGNALAEAYLSRSDLAEGIAFDPRDHDGEDMTRAYADLPQRRAIDPRLLEAVPGGTAPAFEDMDLLTREPGAAERAVIDSGIALSRGMLPDLQGDASQREVVAAIARAMPIVDQPEALAWLWLDQLGWPWRCVTSATDGVLFGVALDGVAAYWPDIVRRTLDAGADPSATAAFFDVAVRYDPARFDHGWWDAARVGFDQGWIVATR